MVAQVRAEKANVSHSHSNYAASTHSHSGYVATTDYALTSISKTLTLSTSWIDTGITGTNLATGSYLVQVSGMSSTATGLYSEVFTGVMSWYADTTNSGEANEIILHAAGHANGGRHIYLKTIRTGSSGRLKLQIAGSASMSSSAYVFKFRRLI